MKHLTSITIFAAICVAMGFIIGFEVGWHARTVKELWKWLKSKWGEERLN